MKLARYLPILGIIALVIVLWRMDLRAIGESLEDASWIWLLGLIPVAISQIIRSLRWLILIRRLGGDSSFWEAFRGYHIGTAFGAFTPGRVGMFVRVPLLRMKADRAAASVLADFLLEVFGIVIVAAVGGLIVIKGFGIGQWQTLALALAALLLLAILFIFHRPLIRILRTSLYRFIPTKYHTGVLKGVDSSLLAVSGIGGGALFVGFLMSIISWAIILIAGLFVGASLGFHLPWIFVLSSLAVATFVAVLPLSIYGLGTREAMVVLLFAAMAIQKEKAVAFSILFALLVAWIPAILGGILGISYRPKKG